MALPAGKDLVGRKVRREGDDGRLVEVKDVVAVNIDGEVEDYFIYIGRNGFAKAKPARLINAVEALSEDDLDPVA